jgi:hypothetical protein
MSINSIAQADHSRLSDKAFKEAFGFSRQDYQVAFRTEEETVDTNACPAGWDKDAHGRFWWKVICAAADISGHPTGNLQGPSRPKAEPERSEIRTAKRAIAMVLEDAEYSKQESAKALDLSVRQIGQLIGDGRADQAAVDFADELKREIGGV